VQEKEGGSKGNMKVQRPLGSISSTFARQAKIRWRIAIGKNFGIQFHQYNYTTFMGLKFANFVCRLPNAICHKKHQFF
jgi:hypothetical protein